MVVINRLIWDEWNLVHISRHQVNPSEVEEICIGSPYTTQTYAGRIRVIGLTQTGRMLTAILAPEGEGVYYPVTARPTSSKEHRIYNQQLGGEKIA